MDPLEVELLCGIIEDPELLTVVLDTSNICVWAKQDVL